MPFRVGIVGCGFAGVNSPDSHLSAYRDCPDTEVVALCDIDMSKLTHFTKYHTYTSYEKMAQREALDIISICTPYETHSEITCGVAPLTRALYVEKPIALTLGEADRMIEVCHQHNVILQINHQRRFAMPIMRWSRGLVNNGSHAFDLIRQMGAIGKVQMEYVDTKDYIFELDIFSDPKPGRLTLRGIEHLVRCLKEGKQSISSGREARESLRQVLEYERDRANSQK